MPSSDLTPLRQYIVQEIHQRGHKITRTDLIVRRGRSACAVLVRVGEYEARFYGQALPRPVGDSLLTLLRGCLAVSADFKQSEVIGGQVPDWCAYFIMASVHFGGVDE